MRKNRIKNTGVKYETNSRAVGLISAIFIFILNVNGLNTSIKRQRSSASPHFYSALYWSRQLGKEKQIRKEKGKAILQKTFLCIRKILNNL